MIFDTLNKDINDSRLEKNAEKLAILQTLKADIQKAAIDTQKEVSDEMVIDVVAKNVKQFSEALELYSKANMEDKIIETKHRLDVMSAYLPAQASEDEVIAMVNQVKTTVGAVTKKDMCKMMKELTPMFKGKFDSKRLSQLVSSVLE